VAVADNFSTRCDPMKPAPPVTRIASIERKLVIMIARSDWQTGRLSQPPRPRRNAKIATAGHRKIQIFLKSDRISTRSDLCFCVNLWLIMKAQKMG